mmetsp:Transcript_18716/g.41792  ORF Transcript_18716/g.41792 Transcript_18716/m.41792 type:complete len:202 (-) Transcript_18716:40-645(-)
MGRKDALYTSCCDDAESNVWSRRKVFASNALCMRIVCPSSSSCTQMSGCVTVSLAAASLKSSWIRGRRRTHTRMRLRSSIGPNPGPGPGQGWEDITGRSASKQLRDDAAGHSRQLAGAQCRHRNPTGINASASACTSACASTCPCAGLRRPKLLKKLANVDMDTCFCCWVPLTILSEILATLIVTLSLDLFCRLNEWAKEY